MKLFHLPKIFPFFIWIGLCLFGEKTIAQTIGTVSITGTPVCAGSAVTVTFPVTNGGSGNHYSANTDYSFYLSDATGSFAAPTNLGAFKISAGYSVSDYGVTSGVSQTITIPASIAAGTGYKIAVGSASPAFSGSTGVNASGSFTIHTFQPVPTITTIGSTTFCTGETVELMASTADNYLWNTGATASYIVVSQSGSYSATVTNNDGCSATSVPVNVIVKPSPVISATSNSVVCQGSTLNLSGNVTSGAVGTPAYSWTGPMAFSSVAQNPVITNAGTKNSGDYTLTVTNGNGCSASQTTSVLVNPIPNATITPALSTGAVKKFTGSTILYEYTVTNTGLIADQFNLSAENTGLYDMDNRFLYLGNPITTTPSLQPGTSFTFYLELKVQGNAAKVYNNTVVHVRSSYCSTEVASASVITYEYPGNNPPDPTNAQLEIYKTADTTSATLGVPFTYSILVVNNSTSTAATNVVIQDHVPASLDILSFSPTPATNDNKGTLTWNVGTLAKNRGATTITITVRPKCEAVPSVSNTANVTSTPPDANTSNNSSTLVLPVIDPIAPVARCKPASISIGANGIAILTAAMVNDSSYDSNCSIETITVSPSSFDCSNLGTNNVTLTVTDKYGNRASCTTTVTVSLGTSKGTWAGNASADWSDCKNWSGGLVPDITTDVTIPISTGFYPVVSSSTASVRNITINSNARVTVSGSGVLQIAGTISNSGTFNAVDGTIEMKGGSAQNIAGSMFSSHTIKNLIINNGANILTVSNASMDTLKITGTLSFGNATAKLNSGDNITLVSTALATANVGAVASGNKITGKFNVERYIPARKAWRFLSVPTHNGKSIHGAWQEGETANNTNGIKGRGIQITAPVVPTLGNGIDLNSVSPSMKWYDPIPNSYVGVTNTMAPFDSSRGGYFVFIRGDRTANAVNSPVTATTLRTSGELYTGPQTVKVVPGKFTPVNNPYASSIDLRQLSKSNDIFYYVWDPNLGGNFTAFGYGAFQTLAWDGISNYKVVPGGGSYIGPMPASANFIESGQAFWVSSATDLVINENAKTKGVNGMIMRPHGINDRIAEIQTSLYAVNSQGSTLLVDGTYQQFNAEFSNGIDAMDAKKQVNTAENFSIHSGAKNLVVERRNTPSQSDTIFFNLTGVSVQAYRLVFVAKNFPADGLDGFIEDNYKKTRTPLNPEGTTEFNFTIENIPGSYAANRFRIVFKEAAVLPVTFVWVKATQKGYNVSVEWKIENEKNILHYEVEKSQDGNLFTRSAIVASSNNGAVTYNWLDENVTPGYNYYRIRSVDRDGRSSLSQIVKVLMANSPSAITIHPNRITNGIMNLHLTNQPAGIYKIRLLSPVGQVITSKEMNLATGSSIQQIHWDYKLAHGVYQLQVTRPDGVAEVIKVMY